MVWLTAACRVRDCSFSEWIDEHQFDLAHVIVSSGDVSKLALVNKTRQGTTYVPHANVHAVALDVT